MENKEQDCEPELENDPVSLAKTLLTINEAYKETLDEKLANLRQKLETNLQQQADLIKEISMNGNSKSSNGKNNSGKGSNRDENTAKQAETELSKIKSNYFKDRFNSEPDQNVDQIKKSQMNFYDFIPQLKAEWTLKYRSKLKVAVIKDAIRLLKLPLTQKINFLDEKFKRIRQSFDHKKKEIKLIQVQLKETRSKSKLIDNLKELEILEQINVDDIDWMKIAKIDLESQWTSTECRLVWLNVCSPEINQEKWTNAELKQLVELARKYREHNWEQISLELKTNRSAFLCMKRYHEKTVDKFCKRDWSDAETLELCTLADKLRVGQYIPYNYLCYLNGTRDRNSIYSWHIKIDPNLNHGKWTPSEEKLFEEALEFFKTVYNWQEISEHVMTRTPHQCRDRYELKYHNPEKYINWTVEEDKKLLESYREYDGQWFKIAAYEFPSRNDNACLFRHTRLMTWLKQSTWFEEQEKEMQEFIFMIGKKRIISEEETIDYTKDGELVPKKPHFAQNIYNYAYDLESKKDLIKQFIEQKRQGKINFDILNEIGIYTPSLNTTIIKMRSTHTFINEPFRFTEEFAAEKILAARVKHKMKKQQAQLNSSNEQKTKKPPRRNKLISNLIDVNLDLKNNDQPSTTLESLTNKKSEKITKRLNEKTKMKSLGKKIKKSTKISDLLSARGIDDPTTSEYKIEPQEIVLPKKPTTKIPKKERDKTKHIINLLDYQDPIINEPEPSPKVPKKRGRKKKCPSPTEHEPSAKKSKHIVKTQPIKPVAYSKSPTEHLKALKDFKLVQYEKSQTELSPLVVKLEDVPDQEKIPCVAEQSSLFKFMYLLKKTKSNSNYFFKYTVIKYADRYVAIKPFNSQVTAEYLNETRLGAINKILDQVLKIPTVNRKKI